MPAENDASIWNANRPTPLDRVAQAFTEICSRSDTPAVSGRAIGHGLPSRAMGVPELVEVLPLLEPTTRDAIWCELIRLARDCGEPWPTIATGIALPGLRTAAARLVRDYAGVRPAGRPPRGPDGKPPDSHTHKTLLTATP